MKTMPQIVRITFWVLLGIAILVSSLAINNPSPRSQDGTATPDTQISTVTADVETLSEEGSTDGLMIVAVVIVLIVIVPILLKRQVWENGKRK